VDLTTSKKGQLLFVSVVLISLAILIFIFSTPFLYEFISVAVDDVGGVAGLVMALFLPAILIFLIFQLWRAVIG